MARIYRLPDGTDIDLLKVVAVGPVRLVDANVIGAFAVHLEGAREVCLTATLDEGEEETIEQCMKSIREERARLLKAWELASDQASW